MRDIFLRSGKWRCSTEEPGSPTRLELIDPAAPENKLLVAAPASDPDSRPGGQWGDTQNDAMEEAARDPEIRLWTDEYGIPWRIAMVGPESHYPHPLSERGLVFDSEEAFAGFVEIDPYARLGDLQDHELRRYRDGMRDFGGRRRAFRPPKLHDA